MKLLLTLGSPYARKVRVLVRERAALHLVDEEVMLPLENPPELRQVNPLGKVPVLIPDEGEPIFDSPLITEYLDERLPGSPFVPANWQERLATLRTQALADGIMDAALAAAFERLRTDAAPSAYWMGRWRQAMLSGLDWIEEKAGVLPDIPDIGGIAVACAMGYLDYRHADLAWRDRAPALAEWYSRASARQSMIDTSPL